MSVPSPNFEFLAEHDPLLVRYAALAEQYVFADPNSALIKLRQFGELLVKLTCAHAGVQFDEPDTTLQLLNRLYDTGVTNGMISQLFHGLRKSGNEAVHEGADSQSQAFYQLRMAHLLSIWFHQAFTDPHYVGRKFVPPPDPMEASQQLRDELDRLRKELAQTADDLDRQQLQTASLQDEKRKAEAQAASLYKQLEAALASVESEEEELAAREASEQSVLTLQHAMQGEPAKVEAAQAQAQAASTNFLLNEADTRKLIDEQLRQAGWEVDSATIRHARGVRPQKGKCMAISEWPTSSGPADYVLFIDTSPIAIVEAKRSHRDVAGAIEIGIAIKSRQIKGPRKEP